MITRNYNVKRNLNKFKCYTHSDIISIILECAYSQNSRGYETEYLDTIDTLHNLNNILYNNIIDNEIIDNEIIRIDIKNYSNFYILIDVKNKNYYTIGFYNYENT